MPTPVPSQADIDALTETIRTDGLTHERLCQLLFALIDQFCANLPPRAGRAATRPTPIAPFSS